MPEQDRISLLRRLIGEPVEESATNIAHFRMSNRSWQTRDFEDAVEELRRLSDLRAATVRVKRS